MKTSRRKFLYGVSIISILAYDTALANFAIFQAANNVAASSAWHNLPIVGGGFCTKLAIHSDGSMMTGVDVCSGYIGSTALNQTWSNLLTATSLPADYLPTPYAAGGAYDLCFDPSNSSHMLIMTGVSGRSLTTLLVSANKGLTWSHTNYGPTNDDPNTGNASRLNGQRMAIDPNNANAWYVGNGTGLQITQNAGSSWAAASGIPAGEICGVAIDPNSGTTGGVTNTIWVGSNGNGVYKSTNAGASFSLISGSPISIGHGKLGADGAYYCTPNSTTGGGNLTRIVGVTVATIAGTFQSFALDPVNPARLIGIQPYGGRIYTLNAACNTGAPTATVNNSSTSTSVDAPWIDISASRPNWSASDCQWDPLVVTSAVSQTIGAGSFTFGDVGLGKNIAVNDILRISNTGTFTNYMLGQVTAYGSGSLTVSVGSINEGASQYLGAATGGSGTFSSWTITKERLWVADGLGVCYIDGPAYSAASNIIDQTSGIENLVAITCSVWPPNGPPVLTAADKPIWYIGANPIAATIGQPGYGFDYVSQLAEGNYAAYAQNSPSTIVGSSNAVGSNFAGKSGSGGVVQTAGIGSSWASFAAAPGTRGYWAAASATNFVVCPFGAGTTYYTTNGGASWSAATGAPSPIPGSGVTSFWTAEPLCADSVNIGTFYVFGNGNVYSSTNNGANWAAGTALSGNYLVKLKHPTGQAGHLFFTAGNGSSGGSFASLAALNASHPIAQSFYFSSNGGSTFTALSNVQEVIDFSFSAAAPTKSYPSILICGWVNVAGTYTYGWFRCDNFNPAALGSETWTNLGAYPFNWYDTPTCAGGNPSRYNQWIMGCQGTSFKIFGSPSSSWP
jgi:hypothetical protein